jgi:hypothetical protein
MAPTPQDIVDSFLIVENAQDSTLPDDLLPFILESQLSLLGLVKLLKDALTSEHESQRTRGSFFLVCSLLVFLCTNAVFQALDC